MKKKIWKKLVLHRETLADLDRSDLGMVAGGATETCPENCPYSAHPVRRTCTTCNLTCTTNYC